MRQAPKQLVLIAIGALSAPGVLAAQEKTRIQVGPNMLVTWQGDAALRELQVATDPTNPKNVLSTGTLNRTRHPERGSETRAYYSRDGGYSWNPILYPEAGASFSGDPQVAYGRTGTGYFIALGSGGSGKFGMLFMRSEDGGISWGKALKLPTCDHEQIVVDHTNGRFAGTVYIHALYGRDHGKLDYHVGVIRSTDDGRTWLGFVDVADNHATPDFGMNAVNPVLFTDGELFAPFADFPVTDEGRKGGYSHGYWSASSADGGATFSTPQRLKLATGGDIRGYGFPSFAVDNSSGPFRNRVYVAWFDRMYRPGGAGTGYADTSSDKRPARLLLSYSADRGKTWAKPRVVSPSGMGDQFEWQSVAVNKDGTLAIAWYDTRDTPAGATGAVINRYVTASLDGGETFLPAVRLSSAPSNAAVFARNLTGTSAESAEKAGGTASIGLSGGSFDGGDYLGFTADTDGTFHAVWEDARTGVSEIWSARLRVERAATVVAGQQPKGPDLVEADVTDRVTILLDPLRPYPAPGSVELPVRIRNRSGSPIYGPIAVEVSEMAPAGALLNADNGKSAVGASFNFTRALGDFDALPADGISDAVVWRFKAPATQSDFPRLSFKVRARVERTK